MSALDTIRSMSDQALNGAIRQLSYGDQKWPLRLRQLLIERDRRKACKSPK